jgi:hypothetical protein
LLLPAEARLEMLTVQRPQALLPMAGQQGGGYLLTAQALPQALLLASGQPACLTAQERLATGQGQRPGTPSMEAWRTALRLSMEKRQEMPRRLAVGKLPRRLAPGGESGLIAAD